MPAATLANEAMAYAQDENPEHFLDNAEPFAHGIQAGRRYSTALLDNPFRTIAMSYIRRHFQGEQFQLPAPKQAASSETGIDNAFDSQWHWEHLFLDVAPFQYLADRFSPGSVLDIGCGNGLYLELFRRRGCLDVFGVDGLDLAATVLDAETYATADLQKPFDTGRTHDIVLCLEVAEHIEPDATGILFDTVARHARDLIVFSMAEPGQPGNGHINCRRIDDVLALWQARGWKPDLIETLGLRALSTMSWFRRNLVVLRRGKADDDDAGTAALIRIGQMQYAWYGQEPGVRQVAFTEPFPSGSVGYGRVSRPEPPPLAPDTPHA